jgi:hypothetical protein
MVLTLVERGRKVSFSEVWHSLELNGVRTYAIRYMKLTKDDKDKQGNNDTTYML